MGCEEGSGTLTVADDWLDQEPAPEVFGSSLMYSQSECYKSTSAAPQLTYRQLKKLTYLFGLPLARRGLSEPGLCQILLDYRPGRQPRLRGDLLSGPAPHTFMRRHSVVRYFHYRVAESRTDHDILSDVPSPQVNHGQFDCSGGCCV